MRGKVKAAKRIFNPNEWRPGFLKLPRRIYLGPKIPRYIRPYRWVWLEKVEYKWAEFGHPLYWFDYRISPDEDPDSSSDKVNNGGGD